MIRTMLLVVTLALLVTPQAEVIVTGDNDLLSIDAFRAIAILSPRRLIESLLRPDERS